MRLIDADKLMQGLDEDRLKILAKYHEEDCEPYYGGVLSAIGEVIKNIKNQPTAYDVEKVVEQLESESARWKDSGDAYNDEKEKGVAIGFLKAIEIVKGGGVDDNSN